MRLVGESRLDMDIPCRILSDLTSWHDMLCFIFLTIIPFLFKARWNVQDKKVFNLIFRFKEGKAGESEVKLPPNASVSSLNEGDILR